MNKYLDLSFEPCFGISSRHLQMILSAYLPAGKEPPSENLIVEVGNGDKISCHVSTPPKWADTYRTVVMVHGMGGSACSRYMIRMARKLYYKNVKVVRVNLRNCGSGRGLSKLPYCAGNSSDIFKVLIKIKDKTPNSPIQLIGYSLGGNIGLKLAGELGKKSIDLVEKYIAVCPPFNLEKSIEAILSKQNQIYHKYYLKNILKQGRPWVQNSINSLLQLDERFTGPLWGFSGAKEYYQKCSCINFLPYITKQTNILVAKDDPFIPLSSLDDASISEHVNIWATKFGSHMGFLGPFTSGQFQWMDHILLKWTGVE